MIFWIILIGVAAYFIISQVMGKKKYEGADMTPDREWLAKSAALYARDDTVKRYIMRTDKNFLSQGHIVTDKDGKAVYEEKLLYATATAPYEVDIVNHIIDFTSHHQVGHPTTLTLSAGDERSSFGINLTSTYTFDGEDIWQYIKDNGYGFRVGVSGLGYTVEVTKDDAVIGKLYSSVQGSNFAEEGEIKAVPGAKGNYIVECRDRDIDGLMLVALAFARTDISLKNFKG